MLGVNSKNIKHLDFKNDKRFLGQPKGMLTTSFMALAQAFGNYGMTAILIYYLYEAATTGGLGFSKTEAAQFVNVYNSLTFMCGVVGAYMADRLLGVRKAISIGYAVRTVGYLLLAVPMGGAGFYFASQLLLLVSSACMGTSLYALAGKLYSKDDTRRDAGFTIMYVVNNVGAVAPVITGTVALVLNYNVGFLVAAAVQGAGWVVYVLTQNALFGDAGIAPDDPPKEENGVQKMLFKLIILMLIVVAVIVALLGTGAVSPAAFCNAVSVISIFLPLVYLGYIYKSKKTTRAEAKRLIPFLFIFIGNCFNLMVWNQSTTILAIYAAERVNMNFFGFTLTPAAFQTVPAVYAIIFGTLANMLWTKMGTKQPNTALKAGIGTVLWALGPLFMILPFVLYTADVKVSPLWLMGFYFIVIWGEALTNPVGMSASTKVAPLAFSAQMVTIWELSKSTGAGLSALVVNFYHEGSETPYFLIIGAVTLLVGLVIWIFNKKLSNMME
ncbi:peptide MFS transporter [Clostridium luticellarii]|jgi:POT family proton-dependent oligopeptide transporter|uniref:peptide MFS transporter n=1 Tax=Clostridium luticellarii TaxID=1691940 RepID=UPI00235777E4|nr:oligopeptide:H+ symporter [Clostridium luticellarii]MCI1969215.1 oligopeptide:H+ symporter [Clostridium luticellarii]